jgi:penicillin-binding protein 1A
MGTFGSMPSFEDLENQILTYENHFSRWCGFGKYFKKQVSITLCWFTKNLVQALIATEDARFLWTFGIDARGTLRAIFSLGTSGGASTLTQQQLAKQFTEKDLNFYLLESYKKNGLSPFD